MELWTWWYLKKLDRRPNWYSVLFQRVVKAGFKIGIENDDKDSSKGIRRMVHNATERTSTFCIEISRNLDKAGISVPDGAAYFPDENELW